MIRIGLDLDGVVCDWHRSVLTLFNERGYNFDPSFESPYWDWIKDNVRKEDWDWLWNEGVKVSYEKASPYPGAVSFVHKLRKKGNIVVLTARPEGCWRVTIDWWYRFMYFSPTGFNFFYSGLEKELVKVDYFIEDNYNYANNYAEAYPHANVILFERAWNENGPDSNVIRADTYNEVLKLII
jgi:uncharacterized HAD superfamily protein